LAGLICVSGMVVDARCTRHRYPPARPVTVPGHRPVTTVPAPPAVDEALLRRLLASRGVPSTVDRDGLLLASRSPAHKLAVTLLSHWAATGTALTTAQRAELADHGHRIDTYTALWQRLRALAPNAYLVKGPQIAGLYPAGVLRAAGDIDVVLPGGAHLFSAAADLLGQGFTVQAFTLFPRAGADDCDVLMSVQRDSDTAIGDPYEVELRTPDIATSVRRPAVRLRGGAAEPAAASAVALVAERLERRFTSRDVLDLAVLAGAVGPAGTAMLRDGLDQARLWPQYRELRRLLARAGLLPGDTGDGPVGGTGQGDGGLPTVRRPVPARAADRLRQARRWSHPLRAAGYLAGTTVDADRGRLADLLVRGLHERIGARALLAAGVPLFGVPVDDRPHGTGLLLADRGARLLARTPVGTYLMVAGACQAHWLDDLGRPAAGPAAGTATTGGAR